MEHASDRRRGLASLALAGSLALAAAAIAPLASFAQDEPANSPASITAEDQSSDGTTVVVASVALPAPGFIVIHADADGAPGPVIGHSELLPEGESTDVSVTLDTALTESGVVFPMAHIDADSDGVYEFFPPDETTDIPAVTEEGNVAVVPANISIVPAPANSPASITAEDQSSDGTTVVVASVALPAPGFIVIHADADGAPGPVIGHSELLPEGESTDVSVTLDTALTESGVVFPMAHIDADSDGVYEFFPPDETTDIPAVTEEGNVAVVPANISIED